MINLRISPYKKTLWFVAFAITLVLAIYQRLTGPTHPLRGKIKLADEEISYRLKRSATCGKGAEISLKAPDGVTGVLHYRRHLSNDLWLTKPMSREKEKLLALLPEQPPAGKMQYKVFLLKGDETGIIDVDGGPIILRYKGSVHVSILLPHILFMFAAMVLSARAGLEAFDKEGKPQWYAMATLFCLVLGGFILGPLVQKSAFGAYWTGWPFGSDLTDNKAAIALFAWIYGVYAARREGRGRGAVMLAALIMMAVYLIPHSLKGSEIDHRAGKAINAVPTAVNR